MERVPVPEQAAVIVRIFEEVALGKGFAKISQTLNAEHVPAPRGRFWAMTGVRAIVFRETYRGHVVWGKTRWVYKKGEKKKVRASRASWITTEVPALRIVPEDLWKEAHQRLDRTRSVYLRQTGGRLYGRPEAGLDSKHLLSGFLQCSQCGGSLHAIRRTSRRGEAKTYYVCNGWRVDGSCTNNRSVLVEHMDTSVVEALRAVLHPDLVRDVVERVRVLGLEEPDALADRKRLYEDEATKLGQEITRLAEAVASGGEIQALTEALRSRERRLAEVRAHLEHLDGVAKTTPIPPGASLGKEVEKRLSEWGALLGRQPAMARQIVRRLIVGRIKMTPQPDGPFRWEAQATFTNVLQGVAGLPPAVAGLVPPG